MSVHENLPAWSLPDAARASVAVSPALRLDGVDREWAMGGATGAGVRIAIVDSGVEADHPRVGGVSAAVAVSREGEVGEDVEGDECGHGTAVAGIIRELAPDVELVSVRVLGANSRGSSLGLVCGLEWAVDSGCQIINLSLATTKAETADALHELTDRAYFKRTLVVASAHNMPVESWPWRFASVLSVGSHESGDPHDLVFNPNPPVEFFAHGIDVDVAWSGGGTLIASGNSFA